MGTAYCIHEIFVNPNTRRLADAEVLPELARYEKARDATAADLRALHAKVSSQVGAEQGAIFLAHESILHDPAFTEKIRHGIVDERLSAPAALAQRAERIHAAYLPAPRTNTSRSAWPMSATSWFA